MTVYLNVDYSTGKFYQTFKEEVPGSFPYTKKDGTVVYRKFYPEGVSGILRSVSIKDSPIGRQISIGVDGVDMYYINIGLNSSNGNLDVYAESFIKLSPDLSKNDSVVIRPYSFIPKDSEYKKKGFTIECNGVKLSPIKSSYTTKEGIKVEGDIPELKYKVDNLTGKKVPTLASKEERMDYLLGVLQDTINRIPYTAATASASPQYAEKETNTQSSGSPTPSYNVPEYEEDDLPF